MFSFFGRSAVLSPLLLLPPRPPRSPPRPPLPPPRSPPLLRNWPRSDMPTECDAVWVSRRTTVCDAEVANLEARTTRLFLQFHFGGGGSGEEGVSTMMFIQLCDYFDLHYS